jgi:hypothetical protein
MDLRGYIGTLPDLQKAHQSFVEWKYKLQDISIKRVIITSLRVMNSIYSLSGSAPTTQQLSTLRLQKNRRDLSYMRMDKQRTVCHL